MRFQATLPFGLLTILLSTAVIGASAQTSNAPAANTIRIEAGQIVEIALDAASPKSEFSWILTRDRKFQIAQRTRFFSFRPAQTGVYSLDVSVQDPLLSRNDYRAFTLVVTDPSPLAPVTEHSDGALKAVITTMPAAINGTVYLPPEGGSILTVDGLRSSGKISSYAFDLDNTVDLSGDGNAENDRDNQDTFSEKTGSPLTYLMLGNRQPRKIFLTVTDAVTGQTDRTEISVVFDAPPKNSGNQPVVDGNSPIAITGTGRTAVFSAHLPDAQTAGKELLQEWDFGDRTRSLLTNPTHTYKAPGTFTVTLTVRDITNGNIVFTGNNTVTIQTPIEMTSDSASSQSSTSASSTAPATSQGAMSGSLRSILKVLMIVLVLLGIAFGMYALFIWIKRKTGGHLEKALESMEKNIVKSEKTAEVKVEPLKIKKENPTPVPAAKAQEEILDREKSKTEFQSKTRDNVVPTSASAPVPSWLAKASVSPAPIVPSAPKPMAPAPIVTPPPTPSAPTPTKTVTPNPNPKPISNVQKPAPAPTQTPAAAPVPDWLKQAPKSVTPPPTPTPVEKPSPAPAAAKPAAAPLPSPAPQPTKKPDDDPPIAFIQADSLTK